METLSQHCVMTTLMFIVCSAGYHFGCSANSRRAISQIMNNATTPMHAVQFSAIRPFLATDTWTKGSVNTAADGFALPLELTLVTTSDEDRSLGPEKRSSSPGASPGSWNPAFEAQVARFSP